MSDYFPRQQDFSWDPFIFHPFLELDLDPNTPLNDFYNERTFVHPNDLSPYQQLPQLQQDFQDQDAEGEDDFDDYYTDDAADPDFELDDDDTNLSFSQGRGIRLRSGKTTRYTPYSTPQPSSTRTRCISTDSVSSSSSSLPALSYSPSPTSPGSPDTPSRRRIRPSTTIPVPIPVPNLTKKSRGRRVPTASSLESAVPRGTHRSDPDNSARVDKGARMYMCRVAGCGKCFARGEHLKRHVRSIHTYEKPHKCPYPGCGKDFSRHDNLGQHMRVHKDYVMPKDGLGSLNGYRA